MLAEPFTASACRVAEEETAMPSRRSPARVDPLLGLLSTVLLSLVAWAALIGLMVALL
jgi:hypothetical protein